MPFLAGSLANAALYPYGCWIDHSERAYDLEWFKDWYSHSQTPQKCDDHCRNYGYRYAGLENGGECFCGRNFPRYGQIDPKYCDKWCSGDSNYLCGGAWTMNVYSRLDVYPEPLRTEGYLGCYKDEEDRDFHPYIHDFPHDNTPEKCIQTCFDLEYSYAAVQWGRQCFCGISYGEYGLASASECDYECPGDSKMKCGGSWRNSVYETGRWYQNHPNKNYPEDDTPISSS